MKILNTSFSYINCASHLLSKTYLKTQSQIKPKIITS